TRVNGSYLVKSLWFPATFRPGRRGCWIHASRRGRASDADWLHRPRVEATPVPGSLESMIRATVTKRWTWRNHQAWHRWATGRYPRRLRARPRSFSRIAPANHVKKRKEKVEPALHRRDDCCCNVSSLESNHRVAQVGRPLMHISRRAFIQTTVIGGAGLSAFGFDVGPAYAQARTLK